MNNFVFIDNISYLLSNISTNNIYFKVGIDVSQRETPVSVSFPTQRKFGFWVGARSHSNFIRPISLLDLIKLDVVNVEWI